MAKKEKRGLFETIFGKLRPVKDSGRLGQYRLLSSWESQFLRFSGNAWDISTIRAAVDAFARNAARIQPGHVIRNADGSRKDADSGLGRLLKFNPNPYMTAYAFYYRIAAQFCIDNNVFILPVFDKSGKLAALWPINATRVELVEDGGEILYARLAFGTATAWTCPYTDLIHLRRHYKENDIFGDSNTAILPVLETADSFNQSMGKFAKLVSVIRGVVKFAQSPKDEDLTRQREKFIRENFHIGKDGSGIIVTDARNEYEPLNQKEIPIPSAQLEYIRREIYDYVGVNDAIVQNKAGDEVMDSFYRGALSPFFMQLSQGLTTGIFSDRERAFGNEIICEMDRLQFATLASRVSAAKFLTSVGAASLDQILDIFGMPPIGGEEGARRVQTLNMVNAKIADMYQMLNVGGDIKTGGEDPPQDEEDENA